MASNVVTITVHVKRDVIRRIGEYEVQRVRTYYLGKQLSVNYIVKKAE